MAWTAGTAWTHTHTHTRTHVHTHTHAHTNAHTYAYAHTYTHTHTHLGIDILLVENDKWWKRWRLKSLFDSTCHLKNLIKSCVDRVPLFRNSQDHLTECWTSPPWSPQKMHHSACWPLGTLVCLSENSFTHLSILSQRIYHRHLWVGINEWGLSIWGPLCVCVFFQPPLW